MIMSFQTHSVEKPYSRIYVLPVQPVTDKNGRMNLELIRKPVSKPNFFIQERKFGMNIFHGVQIKI